MNVEEQNVGDVLVLRVNEKRLDAALAPELREQLVKRVSSGHNRLVLDLSQTRVMDSSGLSALIHCLKKLGPRGAIAIAGASGAVARLFELTRMDKVFSLHKDVDAAVADLSS